MKRYHGDVADWAVSGERSCLSGLGDAFDHEVVSEFWVHVAKGGGPIGHHGVKVEAPEFVIDVAGCGFAEEG